MKFEPLTDRTTASFVIRTADETEHHFHIGDTVEVSASGILHVADGQLHPTRNYYFAPGYWQSVEVEVHT